MVKNVAQTTVQCLETKDTVPGCAFYVNITSYLSTCGMENMKASWTMMHSVPVKKYGPKFRASVLSRKNPELCSFCSFLRSWAWSGNLVPSATPDARALSCLPEEKGKQQNRLKGFCVSKLP